MKTIHFNLEQRGKPFKILNATNGGPWHKRHATDQFRSNLAAYKAARIPYSRNHDSAVHGIYGGPYSHDITRIFPNFDADPLDPASYDFECTDEAILVCLEAGTETFFRLGQTIEHQIKKHGTIPPKDFQKWAVICEHIIRHYNEGWANGYHHNIQYWEIWNEPDIDPDDSTNKRCWGGTKAEFFVFFEIAFRHLKQCFPHLKIGGPALCYDEEWAEDFLKTMAEKNLTLDFFSWHIYQCQVAPIRDKARRMRALLDKYGFVNTESHLNEWNYVKGWQNGDFGYSIEAIHGVKGAIYALSCICMGQKEPIDMMMYYDTRPSAFNGIFDFYTYRPLKGYYALYWYGQLYDCVKEIPADEQIDDIYTLCGVDNNGRVSAIITHYNDNDDTASKTVSLDFGKSGTYQLYALDEEHNGEYIGTTSTLTFELANQSALYIKEV